jgi:hypothetical protein
VFRLHIDMPLGDNEAHAANVAKKLLSDIHATCNKHYDEVSRFQYRLARDEDRTPKNFLNKNENGHAATGKAKIIINPELDKQIVPAE